ncbi:MAG: NADH:flavin oxidoreductase [Luminiphilus sp.]|nr:NADH:flavin oxidoreductase [Luminiphilus sp.]
MSAIESLFDPFSLKSLAVDNRVVMAPMTRNHSPDNIPTEASVEYYRRRAAGGVGLIITEGTCPNHIAANGYENVPYFHGEERLAGWKKIVDAVHAEGGKIAPQLWHCGGMRKRGVMPEGDVDGYTPSGMNVPGKVKRYIMTQQDIDDVVQSFAEAARDAQRLGFDAIELHGAHGYLIDQFFWEGTNRRTDGYGGSMAARGRFATEIIAACRAALGPDFPIILRWSQWKQQDFTARLAPSPQLLEAFLRPLIDAGVDVFHCSQRRFWEREFEDSDLNLAGWVKKLTGVPTITVGSVSLDQDFVSQPSEGEGAASEPASIDRLLEMLDRGDFDLVAVGRALIANPDWPKVVRSGDTSGLHAFSKDQLATLT